METQPANRALYDVGLIVNGVDSGGVRVRPFNQMAREAGVSERALIVGKAGRSAPRTERLVYEALIGPEGSSVDPALRIADGSERTVTLVRSQTYIDEAYRPAGFSWETRRWIEYGIGVHYWIIGPATSTLLFLRRSRLRRPEFAL